MEQSKFISYEHNNISFKNLNTFIQNGATALYRSMRDSCSNPSLWVGLPGWTDIPYGKESKPFLCLVSNVICWWVICCLFQINTFDFECALLCFLLMSIVRAALHLNVKSSKIPSGYNYSTEDSGWISV